jgi:hypothetical protein
MPVGIIASYIHYDIIEEFVSYVAMLVGTFYVDMLAHLGLRV